MKFTWNFEFELDEEVAKEWFHNFYGRAKCYNYTNITYTGESFRCLADQLHKHGLTSDDVPDEVYFEIAQQLYDWFVQWRDEEDKK